MTVKDTHFEDLFIQHPPPWTFSDNREGHEGEVNVYDDNGSVVMFCGDMEDCTYADILLAHAIAALPELLEGGQAALTDQRLTNRTDALLRAALAKARGEIR